MRQIISHADYEIEYFVYGKGKKILLAFHGFNNHAEDFKPLGNILGEEYTVVSINLFFHGDSSAGNHIVEKGLSIDDMKNLFTEISNLFPSQKYSLIGYSLGGRFVLKMLEVIPERIERAILLAPDGIRISRFYRVITRFRMGNILLKRVVERSFIFFQLAALVRKFRLVSEKKYQFALGNFDTKEKRKKVYLVWMTLRRVISKKSAVRKIISDNQIPVHLFFGRHDQIIPPSIGLKFQKGMEHLITLHVLDSGHRLLKEKTLKEIGEILKKIENGTENP